MRDVRPPGPPPPRAPGAFVFAALLALLAAALLLAEPRAPAPAAPPQLATLSVRRPGRAAFAGAIAGTATGAAPPGASTAAARAAAAGEPLDLRVIILSQARPLPATNTPLTLAERAAWLADGRAAALGARKRAAVRDVSLARVDAARFAVAYSFLLTAPDPAAAAAQAVEDGASGAAGAAAAAAAMRLLEDENATHGDLRFADSTAEDADLSMKVWLELRAAAALGDHLFLLKCDDDHMVFYDRLLPELLERAPREFLLWGRQGSGATFEGDPTQYTNSAYVMSADVVDAVAADVQASTCHNSPGEDFCMGRSATAGFGAVLRNDERWFNDDTGDPSLCLCKPWTLEDGDALLVHHVRPQLLEAFARNKTRFAEMRYPDRSYL